MSCRVGKRFRKTSWQHAKTLECEDLHRRAGRHADAERCQHGRTTRWSWLLAFPAALALAAPARADTVWAILSFDGVPPVPVGSATLDLDFDPDVLDPVLAGNPSAPTEIAPLTCIGEPPPAPCATSAGPTDGFAQGNAVESGKATIAVISAAGMTEAGDVLAVLFDVEPGAVPAADLTVSSISDVMGTPLAEPPPIGLRFVVPEPGGFALGAAAIATCLALRRRAPR